ncbi:TPA: fimbrial protein [Yersinia enterocolitica]|uniref:fimbrial protein n=1 Tax=Yersinia enterocolitica TaxID=630 RepID=UPI000B000792|nr:fimbrial protein [Yersinia enterocolitica]MBW5834529.1 fimbrial protein [Yersinia enterocolitica]MBX9476897.1 fimbrial protein [Yersinia enterocolitica]MBX9487284.1 fimbrial protein [Yersinia enterocolitica]MBX9492281.1 fimbrial protein [Yersinia enterocolitica]HEI6852626.1 fimbrial protein [Yersinia enterocolitica]
MNPITRLATYHYQGNPLFSHRWRWFLSFVLLSLASPGYAQCVWKGANIGGDNYGASLQLGNVNITSNYIQPIDSILTSSIISLVPARFWSDPEAVIYECDVADKDSLFEVFATNGDSNVGGYTNMGDNYFQTFFPYTALKLIHVDSGIEFTRIWQQVPLKKYDVVGNKIQIKGKHFSQIRAELKKVGTVDRTPGPSSWGCPGPAAESYSGSYTCNQPNGYVVFKGPGMPVPETGYDSATNYQTWGTGRYMAFGMNTSPVSVLTRKNTCVVRNVTPYVVFPIITVNELNDNQTRSADITVDIECQSGTESGINSGQTALGIQTSLPGYLIAQSLGLVNSAGGVSYLLSDHYGTDKRIATGVGISLSDSSGRAMNFVGWGGCVSNCISTTSAGWYPVLTGANANGSHAAGFNNYSHHFTATLKKLPNGTPTAGKIDATAYVLVKIQ